ncbi:GNAT family N-acetyltransferase [Kitasatospora sp. NPDC101176]|uniref:GNAT family N-acetyltransferase n=1 Tax=Kitasatospora sp. NPDC101176 TaxID=3364099 RepID=UPI0038163E8E
MPQHHRCDRRPSPAARSIGFAPFALAERTAEVVDVQTRANLPSPHERDLRARLIAERAQNPAVRAVGAFREERLVGFAFGAPLDPGWWWADEVLLQVRSHAELALRDEPFVVLELHVLPGLQRLGLGTSLMERLCGSSTQPWALLTRKSSAVEAGRFYTSLGFADVPGPGMAGGRFRAMVSALPLAPGSVRRAGRGGAVLPAVTGR